MQRIVSIITKMQRPALALVWLFIFFLELCAELQYVETLESVLSQTL